jgi:anionic cell wall polymer biosynthesis LytR-Cps2A-Psr (LCP) family protein
VQGTNHLDGDGVLAYLRQTDLPRGDPDRVQRQQAVMRGGLYRIMAEESGGPVGVYNLIDAAADAVSVDDTLSNDDLRWLGVELRAIRPVETAFLSAPVGGNAEEGTVLLDPARSAQLWEAVRTDTVGTYAAQNPTDVLGGWAP